MLLSSFHFHYNLAGEVPAVGEPDAVLTDGKGARGDDARCRRRAVAGAFRTIVIHRPIRRSQAVFIVCTIYCRTKLKACVTEVKIEK
mgnify:CR=1 FL=1